MSTKWTEEQKSAIKLRGNRLLVSAAAGSGKTAVLTERIIGRIIDDGIDVDELLVMTFTKAAAAEMKERIRKKLEECNLIHQLALIDSAQISTIHSFCSAVIRDHTDELDIDPSARIAQEAELNLLMSDVMDEMLEEYYAGASEEFISFVDAYGDKSIAKGIEDIILSVYNYAQNDPDPDVWYEKQLNETAFDENRFKEYTDYIVRACKPQISDMLIVMDRLIEICNKPDGPKDYIAIVEEDKENLIAIADSNSYEEFNEGLKNYKFKTRRGKNEGASQELIDEFIALREKLKTRIINPFRKKYSVEDIDEEKKDIEGAGYHVRTLIRLARDFDIRYSQAKRERNVMDFGDLEHMALKILRSGEYKGKYKEIYVDEYQDTNSVQEAIIENLDNGNLFMVGDVKQSIYGFRRARPDIFRKKEESYAKESSVKEECTKGSMSAYLPLAEADESAEHKESSECNESSNNRNNGILIELTQNFRSRREVIDSVNDVFKTVMSSEFGGADYNDRTMLHAGADFCDDKKPEGVLTSGKSEMFIVDAEDIDKDDDRRNAEANLIAMKIHAITDPEHGMYIYDKNEESYRALKYSDIAILLRAGAGSGDMFRTVLNDSGIPAHCETNKGYLDSLEVRTVMAALAAIDNPRRDVEVTAFARSAMIGICDEKLAEVVAEYDSRRSKGSPRSIYEALRNSYDSYASDAVRIIDKYHEMAKYMPILDLITSLLDETGYYDYVSTLPSGPVRKANLDKLKSMAASYAQTGYRGLFNFVRYIENLKTYDTDFGEATALGDKDNVVRIMTVHASKGLEFPVCFICNTDKGFNFKDSKSKVLVDSDLGIGSMYINTQLRYKKDTLLRTAIALKKENEARAEEMRILYVAMTRAREQLYISASTKDVSAIANNVRGIYTAGCWMDWMTITAGMCDASSVTGNAVSGNCTTALSIIPVNDIVKDAEYAIRSSIAMRDRLDSLTVNEEKKKELGALIEYVYPHEADVNLRNKVSISELKKRDMKLYESANEDAEKAEWIQKDVSHNIGATRGTAYHTVMEKFPYRDFCGSNKSCEAGSDNRSIQSELVSAAIDATGLDEEERRLVNDRDIERFMKSPLGKAFATADSENRLHREEQFIMGLSAREIGEADSDETVLIQGIIDAYIEDEDGIILVDYKTDRVNSSEELTARYRTQLKYYARALEMMKRKKVKAQIIYSFALGESIEL